MVHVLSEEIMHLESIPEALAFAMLNVCSTAQDIKLLKAILKQVQAGNDSTFPTSISVLASVVRACVACELYDEACDLYEEKIALQETTPDAQLNGLVMKLPPKPNGILWHRISWNKALA